MSRALVVTFPGATPEGFEWAATAVQREADRLGGVVVVARMSRVSRAFMWVARRVA